MHYHKNRHDHHKENSDDKFYKGLLIGIAVGSVLLWLFTTEKGKRIRKELQGDTNQWLDIARDFLEENEIFEKEEVPLPQTSPVIKEKEISISPSLVQPTATTTAAVKKLFRRKKPLFLTHKQSQ